MKDLHILEVTPRDGAYVINYQFQPIDIAQIAKGLETAGFELIEIGGHGCGLGASPRYGLAAATDEEYLAAVTLVLKRAKLSAFIIPEVGTMKDLELAAKYDVRLIRVGANITEIDKTKEYIRYAKDLGMVTTTNMMKTYLLSPEKAAEKAALAERYGVDIVYIVDSVGGMFPSAIREYVKVMKDKVGVPIGFHGHNNLMMATSGTLEAIDAGATWVDSTLQGMGRSGGNTQTEVLIAVLQKLGIETGIDLFKVIEVGEKIVKPLMARPQGVDAESILLGLADVHSSSLKKIYKAADTYKVLARDIITELGKKRIARTPLDTVMNIAKELAEKGTESPAEGGSQ